MAGGIPGFCNLVNILTTHGIFNRINWQLQKEMVILLEHIKKRCYDFAHKVPVELGAIQDLLTKIDEIDAHALHSGSLRQFKARGRLLASDISSTCYSKPENGSLMPRR